MHHYIPEFFIKGFCNEDKQVYVYNKRYGIIEKRPKYPSQIMFEPGKNTIYKHGKISTEIEDVLLKGADNYFAKHIIPLRNLSIESKPLNVERALTIRYFMLSTFWRIPFSDSIYKAMFDRDMLDKVDDNALKIDGISIDDFQKLRRAITPTIEMRNWISNPSRIDHDILFDQDEPMFLLSDNPIIFKHRPNTIYEMASSEFYLPISSTRIYSTIADEEKYFNLVMCFAYNVLQINQAQRFVCSPDRKTLEMYVEGYKHMKLHNNLHHAWKTLFEKGNNL